MGIYYGPPPGIAFSTYFDTDPAWLDDLCVWARTEPCIKALWLFGSRASGVRTPKTGQSPVPDLDIAFEVDGETEDERFQNAFVGGVAQEVEFSRAFGVPVDLQFMDSTTPRVRSYVAKAGRRFYVRAD